MLLFAYTLIISTRIFKISTFFYQGIKKILNILLYYIIQFYSQPPYQLELRRFSTENEIYFLQREAWSLLFSIALSYKGFTYIQYLIIKYKLIKYSVRCEGGNIVGSVEV